MQTQKQTRHLVFSALCAALCVVLPLALHAIPRAGNVLLPMHIPVLLCGLACGPLWGLGCGVLGPVLSSLITGMPVPAYLPGMMLELAAYGLAAGLLVRVIRTGRPLLDLYVAMVLAMLAGRIVYGAANALFLRAGDYSLQIWLTSAFVTGLPGIAVQLVLIPGVVRALQKAHIL